MTTSKPSPAPAAGKVTSVGGGEPDPEALKGIPDPSGEVSNREDGSGTRQREPKPEDYPASAKVTPPDVQVNPRNAGAIGRLIDQPADAETNSQKALDDGIEAHNKKLEEAAAATKKIVEAKRDLDDEAAKLD